MPNWREQYERMKRWRKRVQRGRTDPDDVRDNFFAFTQSCYHLVDWLESDKSQPVRRREADQFVEESAPLHFCRDICNGSKHARLEAKRGEVTDKPINLGPEVVCELTVEFHGNSYTAAWFTGLCIAEWNKLLREKGLLPRRPKGK